LGNPLMQLCQLFKIKSTKRINGKSAFFLKKEKVNHTRNNLEHTPISCSVVKGVVQEQVDPLYVNPCAADVDSVETDSTKRSDIKNCESDLNELSADKVMDNGKPLAEDSIKHNVSTELVAEPGPPQPKRLKILFPPKPTLLYLNSLKPTCLNPLLSKSLQPVPLKAKPVQVKAKRPKPEPEDPEPKMSPAPRYPAVFKGKGRSWRLRCGQDQVGINIFHNFRGACLSCEEDISTVDLALEHVKHLLGPSFQTSEPKESIKFNGKRKKMERTFNCPVCTKAQFGENKDLALLIHMKRHIIAIHEGRKNCEDCRNSYDSSFEYMEHLPKCRTRKECQHCGKLFLNLNTHQPDCLRKKTGGEWKCKDCDFVSSSINKYNDHRQEVHSQYSRWCENCGKILKNSRAWNKHSKACKGGDQLNCDQCDFKCSRSNILKSHMEKVHSNYCQICEECGKTFNNSQAWRNHSHNIERKDQDFVCDLCGKRFVRYSSLEGHKKAMHELLYHYQCTYCKRKFKNIWDARMHSVVHSDLRPFECSTCGLRFNHRSVAGKHKSGTHPSAVIFHVQKEEVENLAKKLVIKIEPEKIQERQKGRRYKNMKKVSLESMDDDNLLNSTVSEGS